MTKRPLAPLTLTALGVVYGDIVSVEPPGHDLYNVRVQYGFMVEM